MPETVRTIAPGGSFISRHSGRVVTVPKTHMGLRCEIGKTCEWELLFPKREATLIEKVRKQHIGIVHFQELLEGRCQLNETELDLAL